MVDFLILPNEREHRENDEQNEEVDANLFIREFDPFVRSVVDFSTEQLQHAELEVSERFTPGVAQVIEIDVLFADFELGKRCNYSERDQINCQDAHSHSQVFDTPVFDTSVESEYSKSNY